MRAPRPTARIGGGPRVIRGLSWVASALVLVGLTALLFAGQANVSIGGANPPWVGHRWHPIVVGATITVALSLSALVALTRKRVRIKTALALLLMATTSLDVASVSWHHRAFGTRSDLARAFAALRLGPDAVPTSETYLAGPGGYQTPDNPSAIRSWRINSPAPRPCSTLARAAQRWSSDGVVNSYNNDPTSYSRGCSFEVRYGQFTTEFWDAGPIGTSSWTLKAWMRS